MAEAETRGGAPERRAATIADGPRERLRASRWLVLGLAVVMAILGSTGLVTWSGAAIAFAAALALLVLAPRNVEQPWRRRDLLDPRLESVDLGIVNLAAALPEPCFILDRRGIIRVANGAAGTLFPIRVGDPLTARLRVPDLLAAFERVADGGQPERVEFTERVPTERWFSGWFAGLGKRDDSSPPDLIVLIVEDLTERRRADRVRVDFVANASHELRTPLASLAGFIETLQGPARSDPEAQDRFLAIMHEQATRMSRLIDDLLSLSRIEMKVHLRPDAEVDIVEIVRHVADALDPLARELGVAIETDVPDEPVIIAGDHDELVQVFDNLVENACRYGRSGKRVVLTVKPPAGPGGGCSVSVRDFGPGIASEHVPRLTERFYRVDAEVSRQHRGTGLGLAIVKHIANRHRARLTVDSAPGEGSTFTVEFPLSISGNVVDEEL